MYGLIEENSEILEQFFLILTHFFSHSDYKITTVQINDSTNGDGDGRTPYDLFVLEEGQGTGQGRFRRVNF
jgi:hypothetical protein